MSLNPCKGRDFTITKLISTLILGTCNISPTKAF